MKPSAPMRVHVQGSGKVGRALRRGLRRAGWSVGARSARKGLPQSLRANAIVLAVRDGQLEAEAQRWAAAGIVPPHAVVLHVAGALTAEVLAALRPCCAGVGQMHPLMSFASERRTPELRGAYALISGDLRAVRVAKQLASALGMRTRLGNAVDRTAYHAAAWMVAGGAVALSAAARDLLMAGGFDAREAERMLAPLLRSVSENVGALGLPQALTGVVRRADAVTLSRHAQALERLAPEHLPLYLAQASAQMSMARALGEASAGALDELAAEIDAWETKADGFRTPLKCKGRKSQQELRRGTGMDVQSLIESFQIDSLDPNGVRR